jgi:hypothetical protein
MKYRIVTGASLALLLVGCVLGEEPFKSGPQVGEGIPGPFHPLNINGGNAGQKACQI